MCSTSCGTVVTFVEELPAEMRASDFLSVQSGPAVLSARNVRAGNHIYNIFDVKASENVFEGCFFYNTTMVRPLRHCILILFDDSSFLHDAVRTPVVRGLMLLYSTP